MASPTSISRAEGRHNVRNWKPAFVGAVLCLLTACQFLLHIPASPSSSPRLLSHDFIRGRSTIIQRPLQYGSTGVTILVGDDAGSTLPQIAADLLGEYGPDKGGNPDILVALGFSSATRHLVAEKEIESLTSQDSFIVRAGYDASGRTIYVCAGRTQRAVGYAFFELLQNIGFAFVHPLRPVRPASLPQQWPILDLKEEPRWEFRGTHYHTEHPLELTNLLNGVDAEGGVLDRGRWQANFFEWEAYLNWMLAQKQNYIEWMLLADLKAPRDGAHTGFQLSSERQARLQMLVKAAHARGILVGVDVPLTQQQQHAMSLLPESTGRWAVDLEQVKQRARWLLDCGFDHFGTELGATEFHRGLSAEYMIRMLNATKDILGPDRHLLVKNHVSIKQHADGYRDPRPGHNGHTLNFNYLSYFANPEIVAMPHTVQIYSLQDPAPTYGNVDFSDLRDWTRFLLEQGRPVVFYPETAYWVNYDSSVPLFLAPSYTKSRITDAADLDTFPGPKPLMGQMNFESGWQWGYWLANSAQSAVAWQALPDEHAVFKRVLRFLDPHLAEQVADLLVEYADAQKALLIDGDPEAPFAPGLGRASTTGIAYLQGSEGLSDLGGLAARYLGEGAPQPDRLRFSDLWADPPLFSLTLLRVATGHADWDTVTGGRHKAEARRQWYRDHLRPLLSKMNVTFHDLAVKFTEIPPVHAEAVGLLRDLDNSAQLLRLRCIQVLALYDHAADCDTNNATSVSSSWCMERLATARASIQAALNVVREGEQHYGLQDSSRISAWRTPNPTAYAYGYLWAAHNLFYWQRDQAIVEQRIQNPCFATINDIVDLGLQGGGSRLVQRVRDMLQGVLGSSSLSECLGIPKEEPSPLR